MRTFAIALLSMVVSFAFSICRSPAQGPADDPVGLEQQIQGLLKENRFGEVLRKRVDLARIRFGSDSVQYADAIVANGAPNLFGRNESDMRLALQIYEKQLGPDDPKIVGPLFVLATGYMLDKARIRDAEPIIHRALSIVEKESGTDAPAYADVLTMLAQFHSRTGKVVEAETQFRQTFLIYENSLGANSRRALAALSSLAQLYGDNHRREDQLQVQRQIVDIKQAAQGPDHQETLAAMGVLATLLRSQCRDEEAATLERKIKPKILPGRAEGLLRHAGTVEKRGGTPTEDLIEAGNIYVKLHRLSEARQAYDRAIAGLVKFYSENRTQTPVKKSVQYATAQAGIAEVDRLEGHIDAAEQGYREVIATFDEINYPAFPVAWLDSLEAIYRTKQLQSEADATKQRAAVRRAELDSLRRCKS